MINHIPFPKHPLDEKSKPTSMSSKPVEVAVIGGGMGGLCCAIGCLKHPNLSVQIYEAAHHFSEIGAGVAVGPNAQRAMKLIGKSTEEAYNRCATHNQWKQYSNTWFEYRVGMGPEEGKKLAAARNETGQSTVHRAKFLDEFVKLVPPEICHFGKRLTHIEELSSGRIKLFFKDDTTAEADCVIGADGIHSVIRSHLLGSDDPNVDPVFTGFVAYRELVPMEKAIAKIGEKYATNSFVWCGDGGCVMTYPIEFGATMNIVAINSSVDKWEGAWVQKADYKKIAAEFKAWEGTAKKIIELLNTDDVAAWSMWDLKPAKTFHRNNVVMLGDAAHATTPFQGQGAGQAIEDAYVLETLLSHVEKPEEAALAFRAYDMIRRPRSQRVVTTSRETGEIVAMRLPGIGHDPDKFRENIEWRMDWMWHRDVEGEANEAMGIFNKLKAGESID